MAGKLKDLFKKLFFYLFTLETFQKNVKTFINYLLIQNH